MDARLEVGITVHRTKSGGDGPHRDGHGERAYRWRADAVDRALDTLDDLGRAAVRTFLRGAIDERSRAGRERLPATR